MTTYASEPGTRLGGRYRLEDRIAAGSGWAAWKAIDETLARAVTVFTFASGFPRVTEVVTAARAASRLTDPRLAQVFDVEDAFDRAYIVMEWAAGETLGDLLSHGPLEPARAARIIAEAAAALSAAHAAGVAHMCLSPGSVRWSQTGEVKVVGLGIDAALSGITADEPVIADTTGLGKLLYAALTAHWPGPDESPGLPAAPLAGGQPCSPRQVIAGVPLALSDLAVRAMQLRDGQDAQPITAPGELARALLAALPPLPVPAAPPPPSWQDQHFRQDQGPGYQDLAPGRGAGTRRRRRQSGQAETDRPGAGDFGGETWPPDAPDLAEGPWPPALPPVERGGRGRRRAASGPLSAGISRKVVFAAVGVLAVIAIAAFTLWPGSGGPAALNHPGNKPSTSSSSDSVLSPAGATGFDPLSTPQEDPSNEQTPLAKFAIDNNQATAWVSQWYRTPEFGMLKSGSGLLIDMGKPVRYSTVTVTFGPEPGAHVELLVGNSSARSKANLDSMTKIGSATNPTGTYTFRIRSNASGQYLVIWFTRLPPAPHSGGKFQAEVFNVIVRGASA